MSTTLNLQIEIFFGEIGEALSYDLLARRNIRCNGAGEGINRAIEMSRSLVPNKGAREGCRVSLLIKEGSILIQVRTWTQLDPNAELVRGPSTEFPLSTPSDIIAGFMISRFPDLP